MNCEWKPQKNICQIELPRSLLLQILLIRSWGEAIAGLCSEACAHENNFVSPQWRVVVAVTWILSPLCRQSSLMSSMGPWKTWSGFKPSQTWPKKLHFWSLDNHLYCIRWVTTSAELFIWYVVLVFIFNFKIRKQRVSHFPPVSQDLLTFTFSLNTRHCHSAVPFMY